MCAILPIIALDSSGSLGFGDHLGLQQHLNGFTTKGDVSSRTPSLGGRARVSEKRDAVAELSLHSHTPPSGVDPETYFLPLATTEG